MTWVIDLLTVNLRYKVLALLLAVTLWGWVQSEQVVSGRIRARMVSQMPTDLVPNQPLPESVVLTVEGPQGLVRNLSRLEPRMGVDLTNATEGAVTIDLGESRIDGLPEGLEVVHLSPPGFSTRLEQRRTRKVPLRPALVGEPARGWKIQEVRVEPKTVLISGPDSVVRGLSEVPTEIVDITDRKEDVTAKVPLTLAEPTLSASLGGRATVEVDIRAVMVTRTFQDLPVMVDAGTADPATVDVEVRGPMNIVEAMQHDGLRVQVVHDGEDRSFRARFGDDKTPYVAVDVPPQLEVVRLSPRSIRVRM